MTADDEHRLFLETRHEFNAGLCTRLLVHVEGRRVCGHCHLNWMVHHITCDDGLLALRVDEHADMIRRVPGGWQQPYLFADLMLVIDEVDQSCRHDRINGIGEVVDGV